MNSKMTPCERLGYKVGDKFKVVGGTGVSYAVGSFITLIHDDGSLCPRFNGVHAIYESGDCFFPIDFVGKVAKLKPAKQALADAIHQNGGWPIEVHWLFSTSSRVGAISFWVCRPKFNSTDWFEGAARRVTVMLNRGLPNWHQCILSRDEYFTAYPEQPKDEVMSKDWHKNGELPPVGEVCEAEYNTTPSVWESVRVVGFDDGECVFRWISGGNAGLIGEYSHPKDFRPLRTERDKAIDEMVDCLSSRWANCEAIAAHLYENGYRKEVK